MQVRFDGRLDIETSVAPEAADALVPSLILQPLVENAVKHAASMRVAPTCIRIRAARDGGRLHLSVEDDGPGAILEQVERAPGAGLRLVRGRLVARDGDSGQMRITTAPGAGFRVDVGLLAGAPALAAAGQG
jgi:LytS/YehU family sensor histidine kinase